ncbi:MAG: response regulator [Candidatus Latescibacterota bacterium]|jgi:two-component system cell cycle sensor histidine kinase/response regulator CckA
MLAAAAVSKKLGTRRFGMVGQGKLNGQVTILVVDDDELLCRAIGRTLNKVGYRVIVAVDGVAGIELSRSHIGPIHLVVADLMMPNGHGLSLVDTLARERPESKIVLISGAVREHMLLSQDRASVHALLEKPFTAASLLRSIGDLL